MKPPLSFVQYSKDADLGGTITRLIYLRLAALVVTTLCFAGWHFFYSPYAYWHITGSLICLVAVWSCYILLRGPIHTKWLHSDTSSILELMIDYAWVCSIVVFSGSTANPFIYYYLVLNALAATMFSARLAWGFCGLGIGIYTVLLISDFSAHFEHFSTDYQIHLMGMWVNFVGSALVTSFFVTKLIAAVRAQQQSLMAIRENNLKNEQLIGLGTVAASTVHNLATPLSTLNLLVDDVATHDNLDQSVREDLALMKTQISRCTTTMTELSRLVEHGDEKVIIDIRELVSKLKEHYALNHPQNPPRIEFNALDNTQVVSTTLFEYAIINLANNAIESSPSTATMHFSVQMDKLIINIENESHLSEAALSTHWGKPSVSQKKTGLGIGSFLANSTIERQGGSVTLELTPLNNEKNQVRVIITCPIASKTQ